MSNKNPLTNVINEYYETQVLANLDPDAEPEEDYLGIQSNDLTYEDALDQQFFLECVSQAAGQLVRESHDYTNELAPEHCKLINVNWPQHNVDAEQELLMIIKTHKGYDFDNCKITSATLAIIERVIEYHATLDPD